MMLSELPFLASFSGDFITVSITDSQELGHTEFGYLFITVYGIK